MVVAYGENLVNNTSLTFIENLSNFFQKVLDFCLKIAYDILVS